MITKQHLLQKITELEYSSRVHTRGLELVRNRANDLENDLELLMAYLNLTIETNPSTRLVKEVFTEHQIA